MAETGFTDKTVSDETRAASRARVKARAMQIATEEIATKVHSTEELDAEVLTVSEELDAAKKLVEYDEHAAAEKLVAAKTRVAELCAATELRTNAKEHAALYHKNSVIFHQASVDTQIATLLYGDGDDVKLKAAETRVAQHLAAVEVCDFEVCAAKARAAKLFIVAAKVRAVDHYAELVKIGKACNYRFSCIVCSYPLLYTVKSCFNCGTKQP